MAANFPVGIDEIRIKRNIALNTEEFFVRAAGDDSKDGLTAGNAFATMDRFWEQLALVRDGAQVICDNTGITDSPGRIVNTPPYLGNIETGFTLTPVGHPLFFQTASLVIRAVPTLLATLTVTGSSTDSVHGMRTLNTSDNLTLNQYQGKSIIGSGVAEFGYIVSNTAGPNSDVVVSSSSVFTAPVQVEEPSASLSYGDISSFFNSGWIHGVASSMVFVGQRLRSDQNNFGNAIRVDPQAEVSFLSCQIEGFNLIGGSGTVTIDGCYLDGVSQAGNQFVSNNGSGWQIRQSYIRDMKMRFHQTGGQMYFMTEVYIEDSEPIGHFGNAESEGNFNITDFEIINGTAAGIEYHGGGPCSAFRGRINGCAGAAIRAFNSGTIRIGDIVGSGNTDVGIDARDGAQVIRSGTTTVTGTAGDTRVGALGITPYASLPLTDPTELVRIA